MEISFINRLFLDAEEEALVSILLFYGEFVVFFGTDCIHYRVVLFLLFEELLLVFKAILICRKDVDFRGCSRNVQHGHTGTFIQRFSLPLEILGVLDHAFRVVHLGLILYGEQHALFLRVDNHGHPHVVILYDRDIIVYGLIEDDCADGIVLDRTYY